MISVRTWGQWEGIFFVSESSFRSRSLDNENEDIQMNRLMVDTVTYKTFTSSLNLAADCATNGQLDPVDINIDTNGGSEPSDVLCSDSTKRRSTSLQDVMMMKNGATDNGN